MRSLLLWLLLAAMTAGCSVDARQQIVGHWSVNPSKTQVPATPFAEAEKQAKELMRTVSVKFRADGTASMSGPILVEGTWTYEDASVTFTPKDEEVAKRIEEQYGNMRFTVDSDAKEMTWRPQTPFGELVLVLRKTG